MLVLGLVGLHRIIQLQLLQRYWSGHRLGFCGIEWFALEMNKDHSVVIEIASKYCISDSFVDCNGYAISSKGFLPIYIYIYICTHTHTYTFHILFHSSLSQDTEYSLSSQSYGFPVVM